MINESLLDTAEFSGFSPREQELQTISSLVEVDIGGLSEQGNVRSNNEDTFLVARLDRTMNTLQTNLPIDTYHASISETCYGMLVADGMGGHAAGEVASQTAVQVMLNLVLQTPDWILRLDEASSDRIIQRTHERVQQIQAALSELARTDRSLSGMGTTLTLAASIGADLMIAHIGDSRAYLMRQGQLQQLTRDHTMAQAMVDAGILTAEVAAKHSLRHVLTGVLTTTDKTVPLEVEWFRLQDGDQILLCSDGLSDMITQSRIEEVLSQSGTASEVCRILIDAALEAGGRDNVTAVLARYRMPLPVVSA